MDFWFDLELRLGKKFSKEDAKKEEKGLAFKHVAQKKESDHQRS